MEFSQLKTHRCKPLVSTKIKTRVLTKMQTRVSKVDLFKTNLHHSTRLLQVTIHLSLLEHKINLTLVGVNLYQTLFNNKALNQNSTTTLSLVKARVKVQDSQWVRLKAILKVTLYSPWAAHLEIM